MSTLKKLPGWTRRIDEMSEHFTEAGLHGLLDNHTITNRLGELLAWGDIGEGELTRWLAERADRVSTASSLNSVVRFEQVFWQKAWKELLGREIEVPPLPKLKRKTIEAITRYGFRLIYLPKITETDYPSDFVKPDLSHPNIEVSRVRHRNLPGRWVAIETIAPSDHNDSKGYGNGTDPLARSLRLQSRFNIPRDVLKAIHLPKTAKFLGLSSQAVRLPSVEEWNLIGNLFRWLNRIRNETLPVFGSANCWEWCENTYSPNGCLVVGSRICGGLTGVVVCYPDLRREGLGFRVLAVL